VTRVSAAGLAALLVCTVVVACGNHEIVVGDDTAIADGASDQSIPDATPPPSLDGGQDGALDGDVPIPDASFDSAPDRDCPLPTPPPPGLCDGGPVAQTFNTMGCTSGYLCAPAVCSNAGGRCVGLAPGTCPGDKFGDSAKYTCGGIGVGCCLP
jgi:hypothetical protein